MELLVSFTSLCRGRFTLAPPLSRFENGVRVGFEGGRSSMVREVRVALPLYIGVVWRQSSPLYPLNQAIQGYPGGRLLGL